MVSDRSTPNCSRRVPQRHDHTRVTPAHLVIAAALLAGVACSDRTPTAPDDALAVGDSANLALVIPLRLRPSISSVNLASTTFVIGGPQVGYSVTIYNPWIAMSGVSLRPLITQGLFHFQDAGAFPVACVPGQPGVLPVGTCTMDGLATSVGNNTGLGSLYPGSASWSLGLYQTNGTTTTALAGKSVPITLVAPPSFTDFSLSSSTIDLGGPQQSWTATVQNPGPDLPGITLQAEITQNGVTHGAGGIVATCPPTAAGTLPTTTGCTMTQLIATNGLSAGPATFTLKLLQNDGQGHEVLFDTRSAPITITGGGPPRITSVDPAATDIYIGYSTSYTVTIANPGAPLSGVGWRAVITQNGNTSPAGGRDLGCVPSQTGLLPTGTCTDGQTFTVSNALSTPSILVAGPASLVITLVQTDPVTGAETVLDTKSRDINLLEPILLSRVKP